MGRGVHTTVNLMPSGKYLMEDFYYAGGLPAVLRQLGENRLLRGAASLGMLRIYVRQHRRYGAISSLPAGIARGGGDAFKGVDEPRPRFHQRHAVQRPAADQPHGRGMVGLAGADLLDQRLLVDWAWSARMPIAGFAGPPSAAPAPRQVNHPHRRNPPRCRGTRGRGDRYAGCPSRFGHYRSAQTSAMASGLSPERLWCG